MTLSTKTQRTAAGLAITALLALAALPGQAAEATAPAAPYALPAGTPAAIRAAIESPERNAETRARDANRKPAELLMLSGVKPGDRVVEFAAFGQYMTQLLSDVVGPQGRVYMIDLPYTAARAGAPSGAFVDKHPNTQYTLVNYNSVELPQGVDVVFNVMYYHDLPLNNIDTAALNAKILQALKPGGIFFVVDHNAAPGSGVRDIKTLHRIDPAVIKAEITRAGFELVEESTLLANPKDDHTLMPFAPGLRGLTDQSVFKFRKPLR
ncbi:MAG: hypothetical protein RL026_1018 [Pseudomonadota bacterium]